MKIKFKTILTYLALVVVFLVIFTYLSVKNSKNCDKFVIDTYESASHIDIPKVTFSDCYYFETEQIRTGIYVLDTEITNLDTYIQKFEFAPTTFEQNGELWTNAYLMHKEASLPDETGDFFFAEGTSKKSEWQCLLDKNTGKMWFQIRWIEKS